MFDLCIAGGGIVGVTAAYRAQAAHPEWRILLLEKKHLGAGASRHAVALSGTVASTPEVGRMSLESDAFYRDLRHRRPRLPIRSLPIVYAVPETRRDFATTRPVEPVELDEIRRVSPLSRVRPGEMLLRGEEALHVDPNGVLGHLAEKLRQSPGVTVCEGEGAVRLRKTGESGLTVETDQGRSFPTRRALLSLGPWGGGSLPAPPPEAGQRVKKIVAMHVETAPDPECPVLYFPEDDAFLCPDVEHGRFLFSIRSTQWDVEPGGEGLTVTEDDRHNGRAVLETYAPDLLPFYADGRVFCDAYTSDGNPLIHRADAWPGVVLATGGNGRGVRLAPAMARRALELLNGTVPEAALRPAAEA